jgi:hypothetical protein
MSCGKKSKQRCGANYNDNNSEQIQKLENIELLNRITKLKNINIEQEQKITKLENANNILNQKIKELSGIPPDSASTEYLAAAVNFKSADK